MGNLIRDLRHGMRILAGKPGFTLAAVSVLALGIGANTAIFSLVNAFLLKPLLVQKPEEVVGCYSRDTRKPEYRAFSYPNYVDLRDNNAVFASLAAHNIAMTGLAEGDATRRVFSDLVSSNYFSTLGVAMFRGRTFTPAEEKPGAQIPVAIVSYPLWKKTGSDPGELGKTLRVNGRTVTVVGIAPEGFTGTAALFSPELYLPFGIYESMINDFEGHGRQLADRNHDALIVGGRLRPGLPLEAADPLLAPIAARLAAAYPAENKDQTFVARRLPRAGVSTNPPNQNELILPAVLLLSMAGVVLLIASLNVANMMLARGTARGKEIAIRLALGGGQRDILRQLFTEGLVLALLGGVAGLAVAYWGTSALVRSLTLLVPVDLVYSAGPDARVLLATMVFCLLSTLLFGLGPAWRLSNASILGNLKEGQYEDFSGGKPRRLFSRRNMLVMGQISLSLMLLTGAGLFLESSIRAARVEPGFRIEGGLIAEVDPSLAGYDEAHGRQIYQALLERLRALPGVESASVAATVPFGTVQFAFNVQRASDAPPSPSVTTSQSSVMQCRYNIVGEDYFKTLAIPLLRGRTFVSSDAAAGKNSPVAILDQQAADRLWPHGDAVGNRIRIVTKQGEAKDREPEVVGVVGNVKEGIFGTDQPHVYLSFPQRYQADMNIHIRLAGAGPETTSRLLDAVRREIRAVDDRMPLLALKTVRGHLDASPDLWIVQTGARMFIVFGAVALLLAMIGLYGVRAYTVGMRTREIGIRMALGAGTGDALGMILREGMMLTAIGVGAGLALSLGLGAILASILYKVRSADPLVLLTAPALLALVSLVACWVPARRAARIDPMVALRDQ